MVGLTGKSAPAGSMHGYTWADVPQHVKDDVLGRAWPLDAALTSQVAGQAGTVRHNKVAQLASGEFVDMEIFVIGSSKGNCISSVAS